MFPHMVEEKVCGSGGRDRSDSGNKMCTLRDRIDDVLEYSQLGLDRVVSTLVESFILDIIT